MKKKAIFILFVISMIVALVKVNSNDVEEEEIILSIEEKQERYNYYAEKDFLSSNEWIKYGNLYERQEKFKEALDCYQNAIEKDEKNSLAYYNKANVQFILKEYEDAFENYKKSYEMPDPNIDLNAALISMAECQLFIDINVAIDLLEFAKTKYNIETYNYDYQIDLFKAIANAHNEEELYNAVIKLVDSIYMNWSLHYQKNVLYHYGNIIKNPDLREKIKNKENECKEYWNEIGN